MLKIHHIHVSENGDIISTGSENPIASHMKAVGKFFYGVIVQPPTSIITDDERVEPTRPGAGWRVCADTFKDDLTQDENINLLGPFGVLMREVRSIGGET